MKIKYSIQLYNTEIDYDKKASTHGLSTHGLSSSFMPEYPYLFNTCTVMEKSKSEKLLEHNYRVTTSLNDVTDWQTTDGSVTHS